MIKIDRYFLLLYVLIIATFGVNGQIQITGKVLDKVDESPLPFSNIILYAHPDSSFIAFTQTDKFGDFKISTNHSYGQYRISISYLGYKSQNYVIDRNEKDLIIYLETDEIVIDEILIKDRQAIKVKKDTLDYDIRKFSDSTELFLSDLLLKLPGFEVSDEGRISVYGKEVQRLLVDNEDLMSTRYDVITQNLRADIVERVQVYFNYMDNEILSNFFRSEQIAVNIVLNSQNRNSLITRLIAGIGNPWFYEGNFNLMGIFNRLKTLTFADAANTGKTVQFRRPERYSNLSIPSYNILGTPSHQVNHFDFGSGRNDLTRLNNIRMISSALKYTISSKWQADISVLLPIENVEKQFTNTFIYQNPEIHDQIDEVNQTIQIKNSYISNQVIGKLSNNTRIQGIFNYNHLGYDDDFRIVNVENINYNPNERGYNTYLNLTHKWNSNMVSLTDVQIGRIHQDHNLNFITNPVNLPFLDSLNFTQFDQNLKINSHLFELNQKFIFKTNDNPIIFDVNHIQKSDIIDIQSDFDDKGFIHQQLIRQIESNAGAGYRFQLSQYNVGFHLKLAHLRFQSGTPNLETLQTDRSFLFPVFNLKLLREWNELKSFELLISHNRLNENISQYIDFNFLTNRYVMRKGKPLPLYNSDWLINMRFQKSTTFPISSFLIDGNLGLTRQDNTPDHRVADNIVFQTWINKPQNNISYHFNISYERLINTLFSTVKTSFGIQSQPFRSILLDENRLINDRIIQLSFSLKTGIDIPINFHVGGDYNRIYTFIQSDLRNQTLLIDKLTAFGDIEWNLSNQIRLEIKNSLYQLTGRDRSASQFIISGVQAAYRPVRQKWSLHFRLHNLFNNQEIIHFTNFDYLQIIRSSAVFNRFGLFSLSYSF